MLTNKDLVLDSDPALRQRCAKVSLPLSDEDRSLLSDMLEYVRNSCDPELCEEYDLSPAVGIAAIQVGVPKAMIAVVIADEEGNPIEYALANPRILSRSVQKAALKSGEGCLSVPGAHPGYVRRPASVKVKGYDLITDQPVEIHADGYLAIVLQHEIDHLSGHLFYDHIDPANPYYCEEDDIFIE